MDDSVLAFVLSYHLLFLVIFICWFHVSLSRNRMTELSKVYLILEMPVLFVFMIAFHDVIFKIKVKLAAFT